MKKGLLSFFAMAALMLVSSIGFAQTTYTRILSVDELEPEAQYIIVGFNNDGDAFAMGYQKTNNRHAVPVKLNGDDITTMVAMDVNDQDHPYEFTLNYIEGGWTFFDPVKGGYLNAPGGGNYLRTQTELTDNGKWTIQESGTDDGLVPVSMGGVDQSIMRYNISSTLFGCYTESSTVSATIYLYKAGGTAILPEPSNYPTNFTARVDENSVILAWNSVAGNTPARAYLLVGSTGNITVPTDGSPVINDLNAADGSVAYNVTNDGSDTFTFNQLPGNSTFHFAIFPYNNVLHSIDYKTDGSYPTTDATIGDSYCLLQSNFANGLDPFEAVDITGDQHWQTGSYEGVYYAKMNGYASGSAHANEDWLITPNLLAGGTVESAKLSFMNAAMYDGNDLLVKVSYDYSGDGNPQNGTWTDITDMFDWSTGDYAWVSTEGELPLGRGSKLYVAFVYVCGDDAATAWEIADVKVMATGFDDVEEQVVTTLSVYPNPTHEMVSFQLKNDAQVNVYDMTGRMVSMKNMVAGEAQFSLASFENGVYFLNIRYTDGKTEVARLVKY